MIKHSMSKHPLYAVYKLMIQRCCNKKNKKYDRYGDRGITVCDDWKNDKKIFFKWAINNGWAIGLQLDRRENDGGYSPDNCRFVTPLVNCLNRAVTIFVTYRGVEKPLKTWSDELGLSYEAMKMRMHRNKNISSVDLFETSLKKCPKRLNKVAKNL